MQRKNLLRKKFNAFFGPPTGFEPGTLQNLRVGLAGALATAATKLGSDNGKST